MQVLKYSAVDYISGFDPSGFVSKRTYYDVECSYAFTSLLKHTYEDHLCDQF